MSSRPKYPNPAPQARPSGEFQVGPGMLVDVQFAVTDEDGHAVALAENRLEFVFGYGDLLPRLEAVLDATLPGDKRSVSLSPGDAFGRRDPSRVLEVDREEFPAEVREGDCYEFENDQGKILVMSVLEVTDELVVLDSNHPLAGQSLRYELTIIGVKPASESELADAERRALAGSDSGVAAEPALISPEQLLRGPRPSSANGGPTPAPSATTASDDSYDSGNEAER